MSLYVWRQNVLQMDSEQDTSPVQEIPLVKCDKRVNHEILPGCKVVTDLDLVITVRVLTSISQQWVWIQLICIYC